MKFSTFCIMAVGLFGLNSLGLSVLRIIVVEMYNSLFSGLWVQAIGCSLLVSMASLICLILLPLMFSK